MHGKIDDDSVVRPTAEPVDLGSSLYRTLTELSPDAIAIHVDGKIAFANPAGLELFRAREPAQVIGRPVLDFVHPDDRPQVLDRVRTMIRTGRPVPRVEERFIAVDGSEVFGEVSASPITHQGGTAILVIIRDISERRRVEAERRRQLAEAERARAQAEEAQHRLALLAEAGRVLAASLDYEITLKTIAHLAVPALADWCVIDVINEDGTIERVVSAHVDPAKEEWAAEIERRYPPDNQGAASLLAMRQSILAREVTDEMLAGSARDAEHLEILKSLGMRSAMSVGLRARGRILGSMTYISAESGRIYGAEDLSQAESLAARAALAVDNARLYQITQRTAAEREAILSQLTDGLILCDTRGKVTFMNEVACQLYGSDFTGNTLGEYGPHSRLLDEQGGHMPLDALPLQRALILSERTMAADARISRPDGTEIMVQRSATPVLAEDGTKLGAVLTVRDVTADRDLDRQKNEFLSLVAHEIRTPLTIIQGSIQLLERETRENERTRRRMRSITRQVRQLGMIVNDLVDLSRLQTGRFACESTPVEYSALTEVVVEQLREIHPDRPIELSLPAGIWIDGDAVHLQQVLINLVQNAVKYGPAGTPIAVTVERKDGAVLTTVCDEGAPIPEEEREHLFDRFYRLPAHRKEHPGGLGLGLSISRAVIEAHGGRIWVPDTPNACFAFSLPERKTPTLAPDLRPTPSQSR